MSDNDHHRWIAHLQAIAGLATGDASDVPGARELTPVLRLAVQGITKTAPDAVHGDVGLWWAVIDHSIDVNDLLDTDTGGPLFRVDRFKAIEVWTESELSGLHALESVAGRRGDSRLHEVVARARDWHLENTQPDNATNRPWALHVFLKAGTSESRLYAETLLHNCMAIQGEPDPFSALILEHAATRLTPHPTTADP